MECLLQKTLPFWQDLTKEEQTLLLNASVWQNFDKGNIVHRSDMPCRGAIALNKGMLRVYVVSEEGREVTLYRIGAGECCVLSASCMLDGIGFDIMIEATEKTQAAFVPLSVLKQNEKVNLFVYKQATERFSDVMWAMQRILFMGADKRVAIFLWDEMVRTRQTTLTITHEELAHNIGSAREVVTKVLKYFSEEGVVALGRGKIEIVNKEALKAYL